MQELTKQRSYHFSPRFKTILAVGAIGFIVWKSLIICRRIFIEMGTGSNFATLYKHPDLQKLAENKTLLSPFRVATIALKDSEDHIFYPASQDYILHPAYVWAYGLESIDGYLSLYPKRYQDFWEQIIWPVISKDRERYNDFHYWGNRIYLFSPSDGFTPKDKVLFEDYYNLELISLANVKYLISYLPLQQNKGGHFVLLPSEVVNLKNFWENKLWYEKLLYMLHGVTPIIPLYIYENKKVFPRFFLVYKVRYFNDSHQLLNELRQASYDDLRSTAYLSFEGRRDSTGDIFSGENSSVNINDNDSVTINNYNSDQISLRVTAEAASILIVTNNYNPYWKAWIDDMEAKVFPVDHTFQGIYMKAGQHKVLLKYMPPYAFIDLHSNGN